MESSLAGTDCRVLLTDAQGVIVHVTHHPAAAQQPVLRKTARVGVNIAESVVGTTAPGIVTCTGQACTVHGAEHYFEYLREMQCAAAPIRDVHGRLAAVLDITVEIAPLRLRRRLGGRRCYATTIENRLLQAQSRDQLLLRFQASPALLGTPLEALAGVAPGRPRGLAQRGGHAPGRRACPRPGPAMRKSCSGSTWPPCCAWPGARRRSRCGWPAGWACGCRRGCRRTTASTSGMRWPAGRSGAGPPDHRRCAATPQPRRRRAGRRRRHAARPQPQADRGHAGRARRQHLAGGAPAAACRAARSIGGSKASSPRCPARRRPGSG